MKLALAAACALAATASAQVAPAPALFTDPANLRGERVSPHTGRELPIDGGEGHNALGLQQMLRRLNTRASLMLIVAHPDDEDGGMLTFYSRGVGARVADLSLTRGEGGQNAVTGDFEDALGLIRTQELLSSDRYTGVNQFFGTEVDFGFSKTKEEAFSKWTHERVLYDAVRAIRIYRPLVIAAVFIGGVTDGHGQHQVSGEIAQEAFKAAGDPNVFPELTREGILPWQPLKVYARVPSFAITDKGLFDYATNQYTPARFTNYVTGEVSTTPPTVDVTIHEGETDPLLTDAAANRSDLPHPDADPNTPLSYVQFARLGLGLQKTQIGPGVRLAAPGTYDVGYHRYGSVLKDQPTHETSFFDGIDTSLEGIATLAPNSPAGLREHLAALSATIRAASSAFDQHNPAGIAPQLSSALENVNATISLVEHAELSPVAKANLLHELRIKRVQLNGAIGDALGLELNASSASPDAVIGHAVGVLTTFTAKAPDATLAGLDLTDRSSLDVARQPGATERPQHLRPTRPISDTLELRGSEVVTVTEPYFYRTNIEQPVYQLRDPALRNAPQTPAALVAWAEVQFRGVVVRVGDVVTHGQQPVSFVPPLSIALMPAIEIAPRGAHEKPFQLTAQVKTNLPHIRPRLELSMPGDWKIESPPADITLNHAGETGDITTSVLPVNLTDQHTPETSITLQAFAIDTASADRNGTNLGYRAVGYPGIPLTNLYTPAETRFASFALQLPVHRRIGYLRGTGDQVPEALASIGLPVSQLTVSDLTPAHLSQFDTVILGVRTYNAHPDLHGAPTRALLDFARNGGNVLVQYQTPEFTAADAPYPLTLGSAEKVVDETDPVELLAPDAPELTTPNRITSADFNGWIEERGHDFMATWDPHYTALTETHDPGQAPQKGGLLTTPLGKGRWTYCAFALYRQLPEAVPGAFRLFTNLVASTQ